MDRAINLPHADARPYGLALLILAQVVCAGFFLWDVAEDWAMSTDPLWHLSTEMGATLALAAAIIFETRSVLRLLERKAHLERSASVAAKAMTEVIEAHFDAWSLTPSERDVANFLVKGMSIAEIATLRGSAEGTVKSHLNAVYRKSGTRNRGELLSLILESLMDRPPPG
ncbi:regulatory protein, luxR family [Tranquillimonas rosea]|uniref:Regulatory protein, luxR family n=1 Tax=Tranquillimonas rosea TaxID=641238 RepID=A0A1H9PBR7_9RHOB|nr:helix-turn-helix transcriptional regulator [Tranquillimonas rosea]SER45646.1 regulatory protein, luxR family [Tranquillimonas rosea]